MNLKYENKQYNQGYNFVIGCDEVGRGCLAGPVVAAAVSFNWLKIKDKGLKIADINDSKLLTAKKREELSGIIKQHALWSIGVASEKIIDKINIHNATLLAMKRAVEKLAEQMNTDTVNGLTLTTDAVQPIGSLSSLSVIPSPSTSGEESLKFDKTSVVKGSLHSSDALLGRDDTKNVFVALDGKFKIPGINHEQEAVVGGDNKILSIAAASIIAKVYRDDLMRKFHLKYPIYNFARHKGYGTLFHRTLIKNHGLCPIHRKSFCQNLLA